MTKHNLQGICLLSPFKDYKRSEKLIFKESKETTLCSAIKVKCIDLMQSTVDKSIAAIDERFM